VAGEHAEEVVFLGGKLQRRAILRHAALVHIDGEPFDFDMHGLGGAAGAMAQSRAQARQQLADRERLFDIIVAPRSSAAIFSASRSLAESTTIGAE